MVRQFKQSRWWILLLLFCCYQGSFLFSIPETPNLFSEESNSLDAQGYFTLLILVITVAVLVWEAIPPDFVMLASAFLLIIFNVISVPEFLSGFASDIIVSLAMLFIIARAIEVSGLLRIIANWVLPKAKNKVMQLFTLMFPLSVISAFINNTPVVLVMTSVVRDWALSKKYAPSKFLIPLSYATILGGGCTLIGTSSNLVVDRLLREIDPSYGLSFFELGKIGLPALCIGYVYMLVWGHRLLPERQEPAERASQEIREFTLEFTVEKECPLIGKALKDLGRTYFQDEHLIEIERGEQLIDSPRADEIILLGDRLIFAGDIAKIAKLHTIQGLKSTADPHFKLDIESSHFSEVVVSESSPLIGKSLQRSNFRTHYGASVIAVYRDGSRVLGRVGKIILRAGDTMMLLSSEVWGEGQTQSHDFYYIQHNVPVPVLVPWRALLLISSLIFMVLAVTFGVPLVIASACVTVVILATKSLSTREARRSIRWNLLILIGGATALGKALLNSGVASYLATGLIHFVGGDPFMLVAGVFLITTLFTEIITNNAAALLIFPIAYKATILSGYDSPEAIRAIGITIAVGCKFALLTPISYQTNAIVYGPGGYQFSDYFKVGIWLKIALTLVSVTLIPYFWPF